MLLGFGAPATAGWLARTFRALDECLSQAGPSVVKVEQYSKFYLAAIGIDAQPAMGPPQVHCEQTCSQTSTPDIFFRFFWTKVLKMFCIGGLGQAGLGVDLALGMIDRLDQVLEQKDTLSFVLGCLFVCIFTIEQATVEIILSEKNILN